MVQSLIMGSAASNLVDTGISCSVNPKTSSSKSFLEDSQRICTRVLVDLVSLLSNVDGKRFATEIVHRLDLPAQLQAVMRWFGDRDQTGPAETGSVTGIGKKATRTRGADSLPNDLEADVLRMQKVDFMDLFGLREVSRGAKKFVESDVFRQSRGGVSEGTFTAIDNNIENNVWRCYGYDSHSESWRSFPPVSSYLPSPSPELFKEYSVGGHGGLTRAEDSKSPTTGGLVVFNPLTGETRELPPLLHPRNPVLVHISVDSAKKSYKVIAAGSSAASDEHLSRKVEVFDSSTSKWKELSDLPGPVFGLNEHQAGVCLNGKLFLISFLEGGGRGVVALDVENGTWLQDLTTPIPWSSYSNTLQLVESDGKLFVFSEQEQDQSADHCIDGLEFQNPKAGGKTCRWRSFVKVRKSGGRGLQVFAENTCAGFKKPGILNSLSWKKLSILLASFSLASLPNGACAGDQSLDSVSGMWKPSNAWESPEFAKKAAATLLVGSSMIGAIVARGIFRRRRARGHRFHNVRELELFDIMAGLEAGEFPNRRDPVFAIPPALPA